MNSTAMIFSSSSPPRSSFRRPFLPALKTPFLLAFAAVPLLSSPAFAATPVITDPSDISPGVVELMTDTDIHFQIVASDNPTSYGATGLPPGLSVDPLTGVIDGNVTSAGSYPVTLSATNNDGSGVLASTFFVYERLPSTPFGDEDVEDGFDTNHFDEDQVVITQSPLNETGDFFYKLSAPSPAVGGSVIRNSGNLSNNTNTGILMLVRGPAEISFTWYVNIEDGWDFFTFFVDNAQIGQLTGATAPATFTHTLGPGLHRLEWLYFRDINDAFGGQDRCILDDFEITGYPEWADEEKMTVFESNFNVDKEQDGNTLLEEYALGLNPKNKELVMPELSFEPDGRAIVEIAKNDEAIGVTVNLEKMNLASPGVWSTALETLVDTDSLLRKREFSAQDKGLYRVNVTSP